MLSMLPVILGAVGLILGVYGAMRQKDLGIEDTQVLSALFLGLLAILGGLLEMAAWLNWTILPK